MIFTPTLIDVLGTFSKVNLGMMFRKGSVQTTCGITGGNKNAAFFLRAFTDAEITDEFVVNDLSKLLGLLKMFKTHEVNVSGRNLVITGDGKKVNMALSLPQFITYQANPDVLKQPDGYETVLTHTHITDILGVYGVFNSENISFMGENGKFIALVSSMENPSSNEGVVELGVTDKEFRAVIDATSFRLDRTNKDPYKLIVSRNGGLYIGNEKFEYFIPLEAKLSKL